MLTKYKPLMREIFAYIGNRLELHMDTMTISREVVAKYPTYITFTQVPPSMQLELVEQLVEQHKYILNNRELSWHKDKSNKTSNKDNK